MIEGLPKPLRHCTPSDLHRHSESRAVRASQSHRQYGVGLLEEAFKLSKKIGPSEAAKLSGVHLSSLKHYRQIRLKEEGHKPKVANGSNTIPDKKKKECHALAMHLFKKKFSKSMRKCWIEAGRIAGVNGRSVESQYVRGLWKP